MKKEYRSYKFWYTLSGIFIRLVYRVKSVGRENIPDGSAIVCSNHSHWADPFLIAYAFGIDQHLHMMAKAELFRTKLAAGIFKSIGTFPVNRGTSDIASARKVLKYLKNGEKVVIFPEGTRTQNDNDTPAKTGAVFFAAKLGVPIIPVYVPRTKRRFQRLNIVIGKPYMVTDSGCELEASECKAASQSLMTRINALKALEPG